MGFDSRGMSSNFTELESINWRFHRAVMGNYQLGKNQLQERMTTHCHGIHRVARGPSAS